MKVTLWVYLWNLTFHLKNVYLNVVAYFERPYLETPPYTIIQIDVAAVTWPEVSKKPKSSLAQGRLDENNPSYKRGWLFQKNGLLFQKNIKFHLKKATKKKICREVEKKKKNFFLKKCQILFADDMQ